MKKVQINLSLLACVTALISIPTGCGNMNTNKNAEVKNMVWNVATYEVVPLDSITLEIPDAETYNDVLPLRYSYTQDESAKVSDILLQNDSILPTQGYSYQWVNYGDPGKMDLVIIASTPLLEQDVKITEVNKLPKSGDIYQVAFRFNDRSLWEKITTANIGKRIAICVNGTVLSAPQVNSPITQGACSVTVPADKVPELLPNVDLSILEK